MRETTVVHIKDAPIKWDEGDAPVYIGRPGPWGNPYPLKDESQRATVLRCFMEFITVQIQADPTLRDKIRALKGKTLVCYCAPKACHGDVLALLAETL